jgi:hypothetical protein
MSNLNLLFRILCLQFFVPNFCKAKFIVSIVNFMVMLCHFHKGKFCNLNVHNAGMQCIVKWRYSPTHSEPCYPGTD